MDHPRFPSAEETVGSSRSPQGHGESLVMNIPRSVATVLVGLLASTASLAQIQIRSTVSDAIVLEAGFPPPTTLRARSTWGPNVPPLSFQQAMLNSNNFANLSVRPAQPPAAGLPIVPGAPGIEIFGDAMVNQSGGGSAPFSSADIRGGIEVEFSSQTLITGEVRLSSVLFSGGALTLDVAGDGSVEAGNAGPSAASFPVVLNAAPFRVDVDFDFLIGFLGPPTGGFHTLLQFVPGPVAYPTTGASCGAQLVTELDAQLGQPPQLSFEGQTSPQSSAGAFVFGGSTLSLPLPANGCILGVNPTSAITATLGTNGEASTSLNVPPGLSGLVLFSQFVSLDTSSGSPDFATSEVSVITLP